VRATPRRCISSLDSPNATTSTPRWLDISAPKEAMSWLHRAAETGYTPAMNEIARRCRPANRFGDYEQTEHWWRRSALAGDREGMTELAKIYRASGNTAEARDLLKTPAWLIVDS
jgi:hypothetical protein